MKAYAHSIKAAQTTKPNADELARRRDAAKADLEDFTNAARADIQRTYETRKKEFLTSIEAYAKINEVYSEKSTETWSTAATSSIEGGLASVPGYKDDNSHTAGAKDDKDESESGTSPYADDDE